MATAEKNKRLGKANTVIDHTLGALHLAGDPYDLKVTLDPTKLSTLTGAALENWKDIEKDPNFPQSITTVGVPVDMILHYPELDELIALNLIVQLDQAFASTEPLFPNVLFGMNLGNDEIGFQLRMFRNKHVATGGMMQIPRENQELLIIGMIIGFLILLI